MTDSYANIAGFKLKMYDNGDGTYSFANAGVLSYSGALASGGNTVGGVKLVDSAGTNKAAIDASGNVAVAPTVSGGTPTETIVSVATTSTSVLAANASRKGLVLQNLGANPITVKLAGGTAVASQGLVLNPQASAGQGGTSVTFGRDLVPTSAITAIATTGATNLYVAEF